MPKQQKPLHKGFLAVVKRLQEALELSHKDLCKSLEDALGDLYPNEYCYVMDVFGDDSAGTVVYCYGGDCYRAPYKIGLTDGTRTTSVDIAAQVDVLPRMVYDEEVDEPEQTGEPATPTEAAELDLTGECIPLKEGAVGQDGTAYLKLIKPGWGSSGYYSPQVLERDGAKAFPLGTKNFWNHQTDAEEAARPEGSLRDLASVLTEDAHYEKNGPAGEGLYAKAKVFEEFRQPVDDLAKHIGMSIRATGKAKEGSAEGKKGPIIEQLTRGISVDYVTTPGAGGQILQLFEAARKPANPKEGADMDETTVQRLIKEAMSPILIENGRLKQQVTMLMAPDAVREGLKDIILPVASKERIVKRVSANLPLTEAGAIDAEKLKKLLEAEALEEAKFLESLGYGNIQGLGTAAVATDDKEALGRFAEAYEENMRGLAQLFCGEGDENKAMRKAFRKGRAA